MKKLEITLWPIFWLKNPDLNKVIHVNVNDNLKVSLYPRIDHFSKKFFFCFKRKKIDSMQSYFWKKVSLDYLSHSCQQVVTRSIDKLALKTVWQIAAYERLPNTCVWYSLRAGLGVVKEIQKFLSICKLEKAPQRKKSGEKGFKNFRSELGWWVG